LETLEFFYENFDFSRVNLLDRKVSIDSPKTVIYGPKHVGKSSLIYSFLQSLPAEKYLYIDFEDFRFSTISKESLSSFVEMNEITSLAFDNYDFSLDFQALLQIESKLDSFIIATSSVVDSSAKNDLNDLKGFDLIKLNALDFEEAILFDAKSQSVTTTFDKFIKNGNYPIYSSTNTLTHEIQNIIKLMANSTIHLQIMISLFRNTSKSISLFALFNDLKKEFKISKDSFYAIVETLRQQEIIYLIKNHKKPKAKQKVYIYNHALYNSVSKSKNFITALNNAIFLEIQKRYCEIYFLDGIDFYIPSKNYIVLSVAFFGNFQVPTISGVILNILKDYNIERVDIVTVSSGYEFFIDDIKCSVMPFYEWALQF
jgi:GTPase SAR1 family protein